jgi:hypothetical protein
VILEWKVEKCLAWAIVKVTSNNGGLLYFKKTNNTSKLVSSK